MGSVLVSFGGIYVIIFHSTYVAMHTAVIPAIWESMVLHESFLKHIFSSGERWPSGRVCDSGARVRGFDTYLHHVVSLSRHIYSPKSTGNTQEAVAPSRHD